MSKKRVPGALTDYPNPVVIVPEVAARLPSFTKVPQAAALLQQPVAKSATSEVLPQPAATMQQAVAQVEFGTFFCHLKLRCFVVIDLKTGAFQPGYAGKMNFYLNVVDDKLRHETDARSIGLILCQDRNRVVAEYALQGFNGLIGVSEYEVTQALPHELQSSLPSIEAIEAELAEPPAKKPSTKRSPKKKGGQA